MSDPLFNSRAESVLARAIYPTPWGSGGAELTQKSALEHTRRALRGLARAGFQVTRNRLGAGHHAPSTAPLLKALEAIRDLDGDAALKDAKAIANGALDQIEEPAQ